MATNTHLPLGIRNNNPGNLRANNLPHLPHSVIDGFVRYRTMIDGLQALNWQIHLNYDGHKLRTIAAFVNRYAPSAENDVSVYEREIATFMRIKPDRIATQDMRLDLAWPRIDLMRAIIHMECGAPPKSFSIGGEWTSAQELAHVDFLNSPEHTF